MKKLYTVLTFLCFLALVSAQPPANVPAGRAFFHEKIDIAQKNILKLGGVTGDINDAATIRVDNLQAHIEADNSLDNTNKQKFLRGLEEALERFVSACKNGSVAVTVLPNLVDEFKSGIALEMAGKSIVPVVAEGQPDASQILLETFAYSKNVGAAEAQDIIISQQMKLHPDPAKVIEILSKHPNLPGACDLIASIARTDPEIIYTRAAASDELSQKIHNCPDKLVAIIGRMAKMLSGRQIFPFLDELYNDKMTFDQIDSSLNNPAQYFKLLVKTEIDYADRMRVRDTPLAKADMEGRIAAKARDLYVNEINALHERPDGERFRVIDNLSPQELYYLAIFSEEEIYTSSYVRGVYPRVFKNKNLRADSLLMSVKFDHFKKWIKMAANYNTLDDFLKRMDKESSQVLMKAFVKGLDRTTSLEDAVDVANSYASITDKEVRNLVLNEVQYSLQKAKTDGNTRGTNIYNILNILFLSMDSVNHIDVPRLLGIPPVFYVNNKTLQDTAGKIIVQQFFYGDDDGKEGYAQFTGLFSNGNWKVTGNDQWVVHTSVGKGTKIVIYSNKPLDEKKGLDDEAQKALCSYLNDHDIEPTVVIHRGHSYYLPTTLKQLEPSAKIVVLGSCGAYQSLNKVLTLCPTAHIVSSKQTGSQRVNGPLISDMLETLRQGKTLNWQILWRQLEREVTDKELFNDYVPPYKNLGALFIMAYNKMNR